MLAEALPADFDWEDFFRGSNARTDWTLTALDLASELLGASRAAIPEEHRIRRRPRWLVGTVLAEWGSGRVPHGVRAPLVLALRRPHALVRGLRLRWPNAVEATVGLGRTFGALPPLTLQLAECARRASGEERRGALTSAPETEERCLATTRSRKDARKASRSSQSLLSRPEHLLGLATLQRSAHGRGAGRRPRERSRAPCTRGCRLRGSPPLEPGALARGRRRPAAVGHQPLAAGAAPYRGPLRRPLGPLDGRAHSHSGGNVPAGLRDARAVQCR